MSRTGGPCFCCHPDCYECFPDLWMTRVQAEFDADPGLTDRLGRELDEVECEPLTDEELRRMMEGTWKLIRRDEEDRARRRQVAGGN